VPAAALVAAWLLSSVQPSVTWNGFLDLTGVVNKPRYSALCALGVAICGILLVLRILGFGSKEKE